MTSLLRALAAFWSGLGLTNYFRRQVLKLADEGREWPTAPTEWGQAIRQKSFEELLEVCLFEDGDVGPAEEGELVIVAMNHPSTFGTPLALAWIGERVTGTVRIIARDNFPAFLRKSLETLGLAILIPRDTPNAVDVLREKLTGVGAMSGAILIFPDKRRPNWWRRLRISHTWRKRIPSLASWTTLPPYSGGLWEILRAVEGRPVRVLVVGQCFSRSDEDLFLPLRFMLLFGAKHFTRVRKYRSQDLPRNRKAFDSWVTEEWEEMNRWIRECRAR